MLRELLYAIAGRCPTHDRASAYRIADLETRLGIDPDAMRKHRANAASLTEGYANPALIDCGRRRCSER